MHQRRCVPALRRRLGGESSNGAHRAERLRRNRASLGVRGGFASRNRGHPARRACADDGEQGHEAQKHEREAPALRQADDEAGYEGGARLQQHPKFRTYREVEGHDVARQPRRQVARARCVVESSFGVEQRRQIRRACALRQPLGHHAQRPRLQEARHARRSSDVHVNEALRLHHRHHAAAAPRQAVQDVAHHDGHDRLERACVRSTTHSQVPARVRKRTPQRRRTVSAGAVYGWFGAWAHRVLRGWKLQPPGARRGASRVAAAHVHASRPAAPAERRPLLCPWRQSAAASRAVGN